MAKFFDKMLDIMNLNDYDDDDEEFENDDELDEYGSLAEKRPFKSYSGGKNYENTTTSTSKVVNFQASVQMEVVVIQPLQFDEAQVICDHIKSKRPVVLNLEKMDKSVAQRIMDFISGSCYTLNGNLQRITNNIFIIAPENVDIAGDFREELKSNGIILPWKNE
ncbi:MAG: cell division protein SepF [Firmicutes bacterium HGW-Firmicutes-7]|nr:MAG: cell division protein SepF [Firmicutes bacterium HGW-Firmicutes-7]